jgi:NADPH2:quinone reductase
MRALTLHEIGGDLSVGDVPEPVPAAGDVMVEMVYASVNPLDVWVSQGSPGVAAANLPWVPGTEGTGFVDGQPVLVRGAGLGVIRQGTTSERLAVPASAVHKVAADLDLAQVAGIGVAGGTAWEAVHTKAHVGPKDRVLVFGASGGVGSLAVQLAKACGATVWGQTSNKAKVDGIAADHVVVADDTELAAALDGFEPTVVLDGLGGAYTPVAVDVLAPAGRLVAYGASADEQVAFNVRTFYRKGLSMLGYSGFVQSPAENQATINTVLAALADGTLHVPVEIVPLRDAANVHHRILAREVEGKLVVDLRAPA